MSDQPTDPSGPTGALARWVADLTVSQVPERVRERAKHLLLDGVGCALVGAQMLDRGWHSGPVFGTHTAAMTAGKLRGLSAAALEDALGLAATQSGGLMAAQIGAMSKRMQHGFAARNGFYAAGLAAAGYTGIKRVFETEYGGFLAVFGEGYDPDASALHTAKVSQPHGAPSDPVTNAELLTKFHALADRVTTETRATAIADVVLHLDELDDLSLLTDLLAAPVAGALD